VRERLRFGIFTISVTEGLPRRRARLWRTSDPSVSKNSETPDQATEVPVCTYFKPYDGLEPSTPPYHGGFALSWLRLRKRLRKPLDTAFSC